MKFDVHCFAGHWPFRRIAYRTVEQVGQLLADAGTTAALLTPMAGIFYKDCLAAVQELCEALPVNSQVSLSPVAVVNPAFPGWQDDLALMVDDLGCVAVRLFPNYHRYSLTDRAVERLLHILTERALPLMLAPRIEDERLHHWLMKIPPVSRLDIRWLLRAFPELKIVLCNMKPDEVDFLQREIVTHPFATVDSSARMPQFYLEEMADTLGADRVVYGTGIPLQYPQPTHQMIVDAGISEDARRKIFYENAIRIFGVRAGTQVWA